MDAVEMHAEPAPAPPAMRNGPSLGFSLGLASGVGPTLGVPVGRALEIELTALPIYTGDAGGGSFGLRFKEYLGKNPRSRMYVVESGSAAGWDESWLWAAGVGAGVEVRRDPSTGLTKWFDVVLTGFGADGGAMVLPLPEVGVAWVF